MISFPLNGSWRVRHGGDFLADIVASRNLSFDKPGYLTLARKATALFTQGENASFNTLIAIVPISTGTAVTYHLITAAGFFTWDGTPDGFAQISGGDEPAWGLDSDALIYLGELTASGGSKVKYYDGVSWSDIATGRTNTNPHPLAVFENRNTLCQADGNVVYQTTAAGTSDDSTNRLTIPVEYKITTMRWFKNNLYIGTRAIGTGHAKLFVWNGAGSQAQAGFDCGADWIFSLEPFDGSIAACTSAGQVLRFNGGGFDELEHFPIYDTPYEWTINADLKSTIGRVANRGMLAKGDVLYINIDGRVRSPLADQPGPYLPEQPSGLWVLDKRVGLYHKAGGVYTPFEVPDFELASGNIAFAEPHAIQTGDPVYFSSVDGVENVVEGRLYYAISLSDTAIAVASSRYDAMQGNAMYLTGTATGGDELIIDVFDTLGAAMTQDMPGCVAPFITDSVPSILGGEVMFGLDATAADGTTSHSSLMTLGLGHNVGSFTTTPVPATDFLDTYESVAQVLKDLALSDHEVILKYRIVRRYGFPNAYRKDATNGLATWTSDTSFSVDTRYKDMNGAEEGDEVDIIEGAGAGNLRHIASVLFEGDTCTITLTEAVPGIEADDKSEVIIDNWKRLEASITPDTLSKNLAVKELPGTNPSNVSAWAQFKVEIRGHEVGMSVLKLSKQAATINT
jgi:hypothetical protein